MSQDLMQYEQMTQLALRGVVRDAIRRVIREDGLPGAHHFYITFLTRFPAVEIDASLADKYPEEITIVLEHQYWDLQAHADEFEVTLKFGGVPKYLKVPYHAITRFHDPSVGFALQFDPPREMEPSVTELTPNFAKQKAAKAEKSPTKSARKSDIKPSPQKSGKMAATTANASVKDSDVKDILEASGEDKDSGEKVVSLDSFRKK